MSKNEKEISIIIDGEKWEEAFENAYKKASKKVKIDGFRVGKVPRDMFIKKYTEQNLLCDAAEACMDYAYAKMLEDNKDLELVARPEINIKELTKDKVEYVFTLILKPEVKLGKYTNLGVKKESNKATKEEIENVINEMRNRYAENVIKDGKIENGDIAIIDFEGFKDGVAFPGGKGENYSLTIGSNTFIPGFEDALIGMQKGEEKDINLTFPEDYHSEDLKGKDVVFKVKVNEVKTVSIPKLDKDFFDDLGMDGVDSKESLEAQVKENIETRKEFDNENKYIDDLLAAAAKEVKVDIPDIMIDEEVDRMMNQYGETLKNQGLTLEMFYQFTNSDEGKLKEQMRPEAANRVTYRLMLEEIAKAEKINITDEEVDKEADKLAKKYEMKKDEFLKMFGGKDMIKYDLEMRAAIEVLKK